MSISWPLERSEDAKANAHLGARFLARVWLAEWTVLVSVSIVLAIAASFVSVLTAYSSTSREGYCHDHWYLTRQVCSHWADWPNGVSWFIYVALSTVFALLAGSLVKLAPSASMSGIPASHSYFQGFEIRSSMSYKTVLVKLAGIGLVSASGSWSGQEAPLVHISSAAAAVIGRMSPISEARVRDLALASTATGISVAFSAPVGGVIFAVEAFIPSREVMWRMFVCSIVATIVSQSLVAPSSGTGGLVVPETGLFQVSYDRVWHTVEIIPFAFLGVLGGLYGSFVSRVASLPSGIYARHKSSSILVVVVLTSGLSWFSASSRIPGTQLSSESFAECRSDATDKEHLLCQDRDSGGLIFTFLLASVSFPMSITLEVPSGISFPSLLTGALLGRLVGLCMQASLEHFPGVSATSFCPDKSQHCITPGVYALVGAGAVLTGVSRLTVSSVVLMFEITGASSFIVPIMTGVIVSKWVVDTFGQSRGIMERWYSREKYPLSPDSTAVIPDSFAGEIMATRDSLVVATANSDDDESIIAPPTAAAHKSVPVIGPNDEFIKLYSTRVRQPEPTIVVTPKATLRLIVSSMTELGLRTIIVCSSRKFLGLITRSDVISVSNHQRPVVSAADADEFEISSADEAY